MPEKIKITKAEIAELYDIIDDDLKQPITSEPQEITANAEFEEFTEIYDKNQEKEFREET